MSPDDRTYLRQVRAQLQQAITSLDAVIAEFEARESPGVTKLVNDGAPAQLSQMEAAIVNQSRIQEAMNRLASGYIMQHAGLGCPPPATPLGVHGSSPRPLNGDWQEYDLQQQAGFANGHPQSALDQRFAADTDEARRMSAAASDPQPIG